MTLGEVGFVFGIAWTVTGALLAWNAIAWTRMRKLFVAADVRKEVSGWLACMSKHVDRCLLKAFNLRQKNVSDPKQWKLEISAADFAECQAYKVTQIDGIALVLAETAPEQVDTTLIGPPDGKVKAGEKVLTP